MRLLAWFEIYYSSKTKKFRLVDDLQSRDFNLYSGKCADIYACKHIHDHSHAYMRYGAASQFPCISMKRHNRNRTNILCDWMVWHVQYTHNRLNFKCIFYFILFWKVFFFFSKLNDFWSCRKWAWSFFYCIPTIYTSISIEYNCDDCWGMILGVFLPIDCLIGSAFMCSSKWDEWERESQTVNCHSDFVNQGESYRFYFDLQFSVGLIVSPIDLILYKIKKKWSISPLWNTSQLSEIIAEYWPLLSSATINIYSRIIYWRPNSAIQKGSSLSENCTDLLCGSTSLKTVLSTQSVCVCAICNKLWNSHPMQVQRTSEIKTIKTKKFMNIKDENMKQVAIWKYTIWNYAVSK